MTQFADQNHYFKPYHQDNALLIQFVLFEVMITSRLARELDEFIEKHLDSWQKFNTVYTCLEKHLQALTGHPLGDKTFGTRGSLSKLKDYSEQFYRTSRDQKQAAEQLHTHIYYTWINALMNLELFKSIHLNVETSESKLTRAKETLTYLLSSIHIIKDLIIPLLKGYTENENLQFFLYRKRDQLAEIYGHSLMEKLLKTTPQENVEIQLLISLREKGFDHLHVGSNKWQQ